MKAILTFVFYLPTISGMVYTIWALIMSGDMYGYLNSALLSIGLVDEPIQFLTTEQYIMPVIILVQLWLSFGTGFLTMVAGFSTVDAQYYEAASIDGVKNRMQELWYITIPMMAPHLMTSALLQITAMFANTSVSETLVGFPSTNYAGHLIMSHLNDYASLRVERGYASAIAVFLFVFMVLLNRFILGKLRRIGE
jgi:multiple sugar transport system permease protein